MAAENAIQNPLLDEVTLKGAKAVLVNITGGLDMTLLEVDEAANAISGQVDPEANIIFGAAFDPSLDGLVRVSVVATGMDGASIAAIEAYEEPRARPLAAANSRAEPAQAPAPLRELEPVYAGAAEPDMAPQPVLAAVDAEPLAAPEAALLFDAPIAPKPVQPSATQVKRIVDPMAAEAEDEPLFGPATFPDDRRAKPGFLSLFGRGRQPARTAAPRGGSGAQPALEALDEHEMEGAEELEIPSFLRRLAN
jgi:cell division protein FtsZ